MRALYPDDECGVWRSRHLAGSNDLAKGKRHLGRGGAPPWYHVILQSNTTPTHVGVVPLPQWVRR
ncbi:MAG: hypothetical protein Q4D93_00005 [Porphyromonas sp.]|nr:hypothetical protein [Porphyromonas sp.]